MSASRLFSRSNLLNSLFLMASTLLLVSSVLLAAPARGQSVGIETLIGSLNVFYEDDFASENGASRIVFIAENMPWKFLDLSRELEASHGGISNLAGKRVSVEINVASSQVLKVSVLSEQRYFDLSLPSLLHFNNLLCAFNTFGYPSSKNAIQTAVNSASYPSIRNYFERTSHGHFSLSSTTTEWKLLPQSETYYESLPDNQIYARLWEDCLTIHGFMPLVESINVNLFFDRDLFEGKASGLVFQPYETTAPQIWSRTTWLDRSAFRIGFQGIKMSIVTHEIGHALGMPHSNNSDYDIDAYDNPWDVMSKAPDGYLETRFVPQPSNSYYYLRLGWIQNEVYDIPKDGLPHDITIDDWQFSSTSNHFVALAKVNGLKRGFAIEVRDGFPAAGVYNEELPDAAGVLVYSYDELRELPSDDEQNGWTYLERATTDENSDVEAPIPVGGVFTTSLSNDPLKVEVLNKTTRGYSVRLTWGTPPPNPGVTNTPPPTSTRPPSGTATPIPTLTPVPPLPDCNSFSFAGVVLFHNTDCHDGSLSLQIVGFYELSQYGFANVASSIYIPSGWSVATWRGPNRTGLYKCVTSTQRDLADLTFDNSGFQLENDVESMEVKNTQNCDGLPGFSSHGRVYTDMNFGGGACDANALDTLIWVDGSCGQVSSVRVASGRSMRLYKSLSGTGASWCFNGEDPYLGDNVFDDGSPMNDQVTAFKAFSLQNCISATPTPTLTPSITPTPFALTGSNGLGLRGYYYDENNWTAFVFSRMDPVVNFNWGENYPAPSGIHYDHFSIEWFGWLQAPLSGVYQLCSISDDTSRITFNTVLLAEGCDNVSLTQGYLYAIRVRYQEFTGAAHISLRWTPPGQAQEVIPQRYLYWAIPGINHPLPTPMPTPTLVPGIGNGLKGDYYNGQNLDSFVFTRTDPTISFNWGGGSPGPGVNSDDFSIRWTGYLLAPETGFYEFSSTADDDLYISLGGNVMLNGWPTNANSSALAEVLHGGAAYPFEVRFRERPGAAHVQIMWKRPSGTWEVIPQAYLFTDAQQATPTYTPSLTPTITLTPSLTPTSPPPAQNDSPISVTFVDTIVSSFNTITLGATTSGDEPTTACGYNVGKTVWYKWVGPGLTNAHVTTKGSNYDTVLSVYVQDNGQWVELGCSDDADEDLSSAVDIVAMTADVYFMVGGYGGVGGNLVITFDERNLLYNGEFEDGSKQPDQWKINLATGGRRKCPLVGDCYYVFNANQPAVSVLKQTRNIWGVIPGDLLDVSTLVSGAGLASGAKLKIKVIYDDGSSAPLVVKFPKVNLPGEQLVSEQIIVSGIVDKLVAKVSRNPGTGKLNVDDIRVVHIIPDVIRDVRNTLSVQSNVVVDKSTPRALPTASSP